MKHFVTISGGRCKTAGRDEMSPCDCWLLAVVFIGAALIDVRPIRLDAADKRLASRQPFQGFLRNLGTENFTDRHHDGRSGICKA